MAEPVATGQIEITPTETGMTVSAYVRGQSDATVTVAATLAIAKNDGNGNISTQQSNTVDIANGETVRIAQTGISMAAKGTVDIDLTIRQNDAVIHSVTHRVEQKLSE